MQVAAVSREMEQTFAARLKAAEERAAAFGAEAEQLRREKARVDPAHTVPRCAPCHFGVLTLLLSP